MPNPNIISGNLPWGNAGGGYVGAIGGLFPSIPGLGALSRQYANSYQNALDLNAANYNNILRGYQQTAANQANTQNQIGQGYGGLTGSIFNTLGLGNGGWGVAGPAAQAIQDLYAQQSGGLTQSLIDRGLGNTTVADQMQRGPALDAAKAYGALGANLAQTAAGYQANIGQAGLNFANQANMQNTALAGNQLNWMNSIQAPYPNAQAYGQLMQGAGQFQQADADRQLRNAMFQGQLGLGYAGLQNARDMAALQAQAAMSGGGGGYGVPQGGPRGGGVLGGEFGPAGYGGGGPGGGYQEGDTAGYPAIEQPWDPNSGNFVGPPAPNSWDPNNPAFVGPQPENSWDPESSNFIGPMPQGDQTIPIGGNGWEPWTQGGVGGGGGGGSGGMDVPNSAVPGNDSFVGPMPGGGDLAFGGKGGGGYDNVELGATRPGPVRLGPPSMSGQGTPMRPGVATLGGGGSGGAIRPGLATLGGGGGGPLRGGMPTGFGGGGGGGSGGMPLGGGIPRSGGYGGMGGGMSRGGMGGGRGVATAGGGGSITRGPFGLPRAGYSAADIRNFFGQLQPGSSGYGGGSSLSGFGQGYNGPGYPNRISVAPSYGPNGPARGAIPGNPAFVGPPAMFAGAGQRPVPGRIPAFGGGGVVTQPTVALVGERGPEAIVPLRRMDPVQPNNPNAWLNSNAGLSQDPSAGHPVYSNTGQVVGYGRGELWHPPGRFGNPTPVVNPYAAGPGGTPSQVDQQRHNAWLQQHGNGPEAYGLTPQGTRAWWQTPAGQDVARQQAAAAQSPLGQLQSRYQQLMMPGRGYDPAAAAALTPHIQNAAYQEWLQRSGVAPNAVNAGYFGLYR